MRNSKHLGFRVIAWWSGVVVMLSSWLFSLSCSGAQLKLAPLFSNHMVLQAEMPVPVWGLAAPGDVVTVTFAGQTKTAKADEKGQWKVTLDAMKVSDKPREMQIVAGKEKQEISDVLVGEVWLCSGQSNMERELGPRPPQPLILNWEQEASAANYPLIRQFRVGGPVVLVKNGRQDSSGNWVSCSPETVKKFSAVAYFFARELYKSRKLPVGIVVSAVGGTPAEMWISKKTLEGISEAIPSDLKPHLGCHYHSKIQPLQPLAMRGVVWYQGESNNERADKYQTVLTALIQDWRQAWGREFPFLFVQIPPHAYVPAELREGQLQTFQKVPRTGMVVTMDCGYSDPKDWHPANKAPVGARLALAARAVAYGEKITYSGPIYCGMKVQGSKAVISFTHVGSGLMAKDGELKGFEIAGADKKFFKAQAVIRNDTVEVTSPSVPAPVTVTYGWARVPDVNLYNKEGLPASPFRTGACPSTR